MQPLRFCLPLLVVETERGLICIILSKIWTACRILDT